jgi:predicted ATPase
MDFMHDHVEILGNIYCQPGRISSNLRTVSHLEHSSLDVVIQRMNLFFVADYPYSACTTVRNTSVLQFRTELQNGESGLNTFNLATHSKMLMLKDLTEQFATNGCHNITGQA